ncbi:MAG: FAD binding domain-containing protein [Candidatus Aminicenantes bacterium]|nr:FAD binding domain-containing protein [Candidatus Aminicenantes bacterium]
MAGKLFLLNDREQIIPRSLGNVLLDILRDDLGLTGTKDACREGDCGSCLVLLGIAQGDGIIYRTVNSCLLPLGEAAGRHIVTIEGLNQADLSPVQQALVDEGAIQCGFCTPGLVVALTGFLLGGAPVTEADGIAELGGNICRCTGHVAIRRAIARLSAQFHDLEPAGEPSSKERVAALVSRGILPEYFLDAPVRLGVLNKSAADEAPAEKQRGHSPVLVAGGTDLYVTQAEKLRDEDPTLLSRREDLQGIRVEGGEIRIGAATPLSALEASPIIKQLFPELGRQLARIASRPVRNRATIAGNIVNASPAGDCSVMFLALNATLALARGRKKRSVALRDFFRGYKVLDLAADEMIAEILFPVPDADTRFGFEKVARRAHLDIAGVSSAIRLRVRDGRIVEAHAAAGGVAPVPLYLRNASALLPGRPISSETARAAAAAAAGEIAPISDVRGSADYKRALLPRLIMAHFLALFPERIREEDLA